jgi:hypothetical protein
MNAPRTPPLPGTGPDLGVRVIGRLG